MRVGLTHQIGSSKVTVAEFFVQYEDTAKLTMKRRSFETLRDIARLHILPAFGTFKLNDLRRERVQRMYSDRLDAGLSAARVRRIHGVLSSARNTAVRWGLLERNICKEVLAPRVPQPEIRPLSKEEAKKFIAAAEGDRYEALFVLGLTSGARWGELTGLFWSDLDLDRGGDTGNAKRKRACPWRGIHWCSPILLGNPSTPRTSSGATSSRC